MVVIECLVDLTREPRAHFGLVAVANRLNEQVLQTSVFEDFAKDIEHTALECFTFDFQFLEEPMVDVAFACFFCDKVPQMADFDLSDTVNTTESLLQAIWIPGEVIIDH